MKKIDDELGGTTPLDVIIKFPSNTPKVAKIDEDDEFSEWDEDNNEENQLIGLLEIKLIK